MDHITLREEFLAAAKAEATDKTKPYNQSLRGLITTFAEAVANSGVITTQSIHNIVEHHIRESSISESMEERSVAERAGKILKECLENIDAPALENA